MKTNIALVILSIATATNLIFALGILPSQIADIRKDSYINTANHSYEVVKLEFCHNNSIAPCDDEQLTEWNAANPEATFELKSPEEIVQIGINAYDVSVSK